MNYLQHLKKSWQMIKRDKKATQEIASDPGSKINATTTLILTAIIETLSGIYVIHLFTKTVLTTIQSTAVTPENTINLLTSNTITSNILGIIGYFTIFLIYHAIAKLLGGKATITQYYNTTTSSQMIRWINAATITTSISLVGIMHSMNALRVMQIFTSLVGLFILLWSILVQLHILEEVHKLPRKRAALLACLPIILFLLLVFIISSIAVLLFLTTTLGLPGLLLFGALMLFVLTVIVGFIRLK